MSTLNLNVYLSKHRLAVRPESLFKLIYLHNKIPSRMLQKKAKHVIFEPEDCYFCSKLRDRYAGITNINPRNLLCRKHRSIYDFNNTRGKAALIKLNYEYYVFNEYALTEMPTDSNGYYVVHLPSSKSSDFERFYVFALSKRYFSEPQYRTNITDILDNNILTINKGGEMWALVKQARTGLYEINKV